MNDNSPEIRNFEFRSGVMSLDFTDPRALALSITMALAASARAGRRETAHIVFATCSGLEALVETWGPLLAIGVSQDPDGYVGWLNDVRYAGQPVWTADMFHPFDVARGFDDYGALQLQGREVPGVSFDSHAIAVELPPGMRTADFAVRFRQEMFPFEFEIAARDPNLVQHRFAAGLPLAAVPRYLVRVEDGTEVYAHAPFVYLLDIDRAIELALEAVATVLGEG